MGGGSGCDSVGRVVASDTRGLRFESRHRQIFIEHLFTNVNYIVKTKIKEKEAGNGPFLYKKNKGLVDNYIKIHDQTDREKF